MITAKSWEPPEINLLPLQPPITTPRWQLLEMSAFEADPACPSGRRGIRGRMEGTAGPRAPTLGACCPTGTWGPRRDFMAKRMIWRFTKMNSSTKTWSATAGMGVRRAGLHSGGGSHSQPGLSPTHTLFPTPGTPQAKRPQGPADPPKPGKHRGPCSAHQEPHGHLDWPHKHPSLHRGAYSRPLPAPQMPGPHGHSGPAP